MSAVLRPLLLLVTGMLAMASWSDAVLAEDVFITSEAGSRGHGWLFGARGRQGAECWIVAPAHVVTDEYTDEVLPFTFSDRSGRQGEADQPIHVADVPPALAVLGGVSDVAFARVVAGRRQGDCLSRLGLQQFIYESILLSPPRLQVVDLIPTSFGTFDVLVAGGSADSAGGGLIDLAPNNPLEGRDHIKQGISGAIARIVRNGEVAPFAMIIQVDPDRVTARAVRFDLIKAAFEVIRAAQQGFTEGTRQGLLFELLEFSASSLEPGQGPTMLLDPQSCWRIGPPNAEMSVQLTIEVPADAERISSISIVQTEDCAKKPARFHIDQRVPPAIGWTRLATCETVHPSGSGRPCHIGLRAPRQFRISFEPRESVGLSAIRLK